MMEGSVLDLPFADDSFDMVFSHGVPYHVPVPRTYKRFMHAPPLSVHGPPSQSVMGWHLWAHLTPIQDGVRCS